MADFTTAIKQRLLPFGKPNAPNGAGQVIPATMPTRSAKPQQALAAPSKIQPGIAKDRVLSFGLGEIFAPGGTQSVEDVASSYWFSALQPVRPSAPSTYRPRQRAFLPGENIIWTPGDDKGGVDFDMLRALADSWDLLRLVIETRKDQLSRIPWEVRAVAQPGETNADRKKRQLEDPTLQGLQEFLKHPDGQHSWRDWLRMWMEDMLVLDAASIYLERDDAGKIANLVPLDGATINRLITDQGRTPRPPSPAFQQVVYGTPACDLTTDDLVYAMRNERTHRRYGFGPVEQILVTIGIGLRKQKFLSSYYTDGNMPEALAFLPANLPMQRVREIQDWFDSVMAGDMAKRRRLTFLPGFGTGDQARPNVVFSKESLLKDELDEWLARIVCYAFSVSPQNLMKQMNRASAQQAASVSEEEGLEPAMTFVEDVMNCIVQQKLGLTDYEFAWQERRDTDVLKQAQADNLLVGKIYTINEIREARGEDRRAEAQADQLGMFTTAGFVPLGQTVQAGGQQDGGGAAAGQGAQGADSKPPVDGARKLPAKKDADDEEPAVEGKGAVKLYLASGDDLPMLKAEPQPLRKVRVNGEMKRGQYVHPELGDLCDVENFAAYDAATNTLLVKGVVDEDAAMRVLLENLATETRQ